MGWLRNNWRLTVVITFTILTGPILRDALLDLGLSKIEALVVHYVVCIPVVLAICWVLERLLPPLRNLG